MKNLQGRISRITKIFSKKELLIAVNFSIYLFVHMTIQTMINRTSTGILDKSTHIWMYYINQTFLVAGFVLFAILWNLIQSDRGRARFIASSAILTYLCLRLRTWARY